jgi:WD40 repeat protein
VTFTRDGKRFLSSGRDNSIRLWDVESGEQLRQFEGHTNFVGSVAFSPDGRHVLSGGYDSTVRLWDVETGKEVRRFVGHTALIDRVAFSPDGRRAVSCGGDFRGNDVTKDLTIRLWDVATGKELHCYEGHSEHIIGLAYSPDGRFLISGSFDKTLRLWQLPK